MDFDENDGNNSRNQNSKQEQSNNKNNQKQHQIQQTQQKEKEKVVQSAVVLMPHESVWEQIQSIRSKHDKSFERWMPHINLLYPFLPANKFQENLEKLRKATSSIEVCC